SDPCVVSAPGGLFVFQRDIIGWLYVNQFSNGGWSGWTWLWGIVNADITAAVDAGGGVDVFIRADDNALWFRRSAGSGSGWARLDAFLTGDRVAFSDASGLYAFIRADDYALWYRRWVGFGWSGWLSIQGLLTANPAIVSDASGLYAFIR